MGERVKLDLAELQWAPSPGRFLFAAGQGPLKYFERVLFIGNIQTQGACNHHGPMKVSDD
jgi:hypothetical protein